MKFVLRGMYGVGDNLLQRAVLRSLMDAGHSVILETFYRAMYEDFEKRGLVLRRIQGIPPRISEFRPLTETRNSFRTVSGVTKITYNADMIHRHGSILAAQYACVGVHMPEQPDFSFPVRPEWRRMARSRVGDTNKPLLVYRPIVLNNVWRAEARAPDPELYAALFRSLRDKYHVVSVANLGNFGEKIVGEHQDVDTRFEHGELPFEILAGLLAEASLVFSCPGVIPVFSQAVGTRTVIVYGANECHRTTGVVGDHLAPTLAIEPSIPCSHHMKTCSCSKHFELAPALGKLEEFACAF